VLPEPVAGVFAAARLLMRGTPASLAASRDPLEALDRAEADESLRPHIFRSLHQPGGFRRALQLFPIPLLPDRIPARLV